MSEPLSTAIAGGVAAGSAGVTFASLFPEATPAVMICALAGAALYVLNAKDNKLWKQVIFALISFVGGGRVLLGYGIRDNCRRHKRRAEPLKPASTD